MAERTHARILTNRQAGILLIFLMVVKAAVDQLIHRGAIPNPNVADALEWVPFVLGLLGVLLVLVIIQGWDATTWYARRGKVMIGLYLACYVVGGIARRFGVVDWLEGLGHPWELIVYATSSLVMVALVAGMVAMVVKDMEERTKRKVREQSEASEAKKHRPPLGTPGATGTYAETE